MTSFKKIRKYMHRSFRIGSLVLLALALMGVAPVQAQTDATAEAPQTAYLVRSPQALSPVLMSAQASLGDTSDFVASEAHVVVVGPAVKALAPGGEYHDALQSSLDRGVRVVACKIAMDKMGVAPDDLMNGVGVVANGFHELFRLQANGVVTLQL